MPTFNLNRDGKRMRRILRSSLLLLIGLGALQNLQAQVAQPPKHQQTVLLISLDGFRSDYLDKHDAPNLKIIAASGVRGSLIPSFPSKTFPNHYAIVTGLYPEENGIIGNTIRDPNIEGTFKLANRDQVADARWWFGEPIWVTAQKQGLRTAPMYWPGSEAPIEGVRPTYWEKYDGK